MLRFAVFNQRTRFAYVKEPCDNIKYNENFQKVNNYEYTLILNASDTMVMRAILNTIVIKLLVFIFIFIFSCNASPGDDLVEFQDCRYQCEQIICYNTPYHILQNIRLEESDLHEDIEHDPYNENWQFQELPLPFHLRMLLWDCELNCDYQCQQIITKERVDIGEEIYQFHGKWPFWRVLGIQEVASMVFSIGNFIVHAAGFVKVLSFMKDTNPLVKYQYTILLICSFITMSAWVCSTVFHIRDFLITERLDYYLAGLTVLSGFYGVFSRLFKLYLPSRKLQRILFTLLCIIGYVGHIYRLVDDWLYTYNMQANITVGILQNILWGFLCFNLYSDYYRLENDEKSTLDNTCHLKYINPKRLLVPSFYARSPKLYSLYPLLLCLIVILGMSLEILDFPPVFFDLVDAHSLWHLVTIIPVVYGWYDWMIWDMEENIGKELKELKEKKNN